MSQSTIRIFTDGACSGNPGPGGWAAIVVEGEKVRELGGGDPQTTNNRMEMLALIRGLEAVGPTDQEILVVTDSKYVIQGSSEWLRGWQRNGWTTSTGKEVSNRDLWETLAALFQRQKRIRWQHVPGHSGIPSNERCDEIAQAFSSGRSTPTLYSGPLRDYEVSLEIPANTAERAEWRSQNKKGAAFYISVVGGKYEKHATWAQCEARVKGVPGAKFKKCSSDAEAQAILASWGVGPNA